MDHQRKRSWFLIVFVFAAFLLLYGTSSLGKPEKVQDEVSAEIPQPGEFKTLYPEMTPTGSPSGAETPEQDPALPDTGLTASPALGASRSNPVPLETWVSAPHWDLQALQVVRGDEAWRRLQEANRLNEPPPEGWEYVLVRIRAKSTYNGDEERMISGCDFDITGGRRIRYPCALVVEPDPPLKARLFLHGETQGWAAFLVKAGETDLILVFDEILNFGSDRHRFIALEPGASVSVPPGLANTQPNDLGISRDDPAPLGETVITNRWEVTVLSMLRGKEAQELIKNANQFNAPPVDGREYVAVQVRMHYLGTLDEAVNISSGSFKSTGGLNVFYETPLVVAPEPRLDFDLYPGGVVEGWVVVQSAEGENGLILVFVPQLDVTEELPRYLSLE